MDSNKLLRAIDGYKGSYAVRAAPLLSPTLLPRPPGELRQGLWEEVDLDAALWKIPAARMKRKLDGKVNGEPHLVPLPRQAVAILKDLHAVTGPVGHMFRGERDHQRAMSDNTVNAVLRRLGCDTSEEITGHGFRATARSSSSSAGRCCKPGPTTWMASSSRFCASRADKPGQPSRYVSGLTGPVS